MRNDVSFAILVAALWMVWAPGGISLNGTTKGAGIDAAAGGAAGAEIGDPAGAARRGAISGAGVGGAAGGIIGHQMDQRAREIDRTVPGAVVERVGEGIRITFPSGLLFDFDSDVVLSDAGATLHQLATKLSKYADSNLMVAGHTDAVGSSDYNQTLSERRADAAARYLTAQGVSRPIATAGLGTREPVASNATEDGRQRNRRVEIAIYASAERQEDARRQAEVGRGHLR